MYNLSSEAKKILLSIARTILENSFDKKENTLKMLDDLKNKLDGCLYNEISIKCGCFVTLHKFGELRGCIGTFRNDKKLYEVVSDMAIQAAFHDPRFSPLEKDELKDIEIEISVLTPMERLENFEDIVIGRDGLYVRKGFYSGVLLPQVATEHGWDKNQFISYTCMKAGLPPDIWKKDKIELYKFSAIVFSEMDI
ncbi:AmmeMemoRadiSam system protein A [Calditerrivibrio nitroreducens]|uniref:AMMECR1 domain protein n=1 Tax=Calditerrivibrio nitroreducens (strain DSM 19672 / NBRC 101217 / Yu37-1) TaxID=768670 RepID=E4THY3_CALNY|nr:AmmeMemoRadiSam system protein A [Calditerrivibrio nitroreducens]ADR18913.1 AMMECR1 domain protein [Calditerrivibrio nitroreducens DSM 19672]